LLRHKEAKRDTIGGIRGASAKLPHHKGLVLTYLMEHETPFIHHVVERHGCDYTIKNDENLNEKDFKISKDKTQVNVGWVGTKFH
jgi:hypothetical protein